ncbi:hypothetical protein [Ekhidna sp.]|uniref:hypothetical protein n=1 Tax=Ekhidna sp. TaxID=2608089 RepID=UPI003BA8F36F
MTNKLFKISTLLFWALAASIFYSCTPEETPQPEGEPGFVRVSLVDLSVEEINSRTENFAPVFDLSDFGMIIYQKGTSNIIRQYAVGAIPTTEIELMDGEYTAVLDNEMSNDITIGHYIGSQDFVVEPQQLTNVDVTVTFQEVYFTFTLLENFYITHKIEVTDPNGLVVTVDDANPYPELYLPTLGSQQEYVFSVINKTSGASIGTARVVSDISAKGYNLSVVPLAGSSLFTFTVDPIIIEDKDFGLNPTEIVGFTGDFDGTNWTSTNNGSATSYNFTPSALSFDCPSGGGGFVSEITIPADGTMEFDWEIIIRTAGQYGDRFSYMINGVRTDLSTAGNASGTESIIVNQGDVFAFLPWGTTQSSSYYGSVTNFVFTY